MRCHVATRYNWTANTPRAHITNQRAVEVLRDMGIEDEARREATPWEWMGDTLFTTSLAGPEIARLRTWGTGDDRIGDYLQASPCGMMDLPQNKMEPLLVKHAAARGASFLFNTEYLRFEQDSQGVTAWLQDRHSGREYTMRARYLVGADGARSKVMEDAGLELEGQLARAATAYVLFRADLTRYAAHRPSVLYWIVTSNAAFGEIGMGLLRAIEPWNQWIAGWGFDFTQGEPDFSKEEVIRRVRLLVGDPNLEIEIDTTSVWYVNQAHAPVYSKGRVFCGGDAVHRHPPSSGLGSNTCMGDAFNLAWKLAFVVKGYAGERLLDSYSLERAPVGEQIVARANQSRRDYAPLNQCFRDTGAADPVAAGLEQACRCGCRWGKAACRTGPGIGTQELRVQCPRRRTQSALHVGSGDPGRRRGPRAVGPGSPVACPGDHPPGRQDPPPLAGGNRRAQGVHPRRRGQGQVLAGDRPVRVGLGGRPRPG